MICSVLAEIWLAAGDEVTITFTGPQLHIELFNHESHAEYFVICFKSVPNNYGRRCPIGYASLYYMTTSAATKYRYHISRQGQISDTRYTEVRGRVVFGEGGSITVLAYKLPSKCTLRLVNAQKFVPTTTTTTTTEKISTTTVVTKETSYGTVYFVVGGLALLLILIVAVGFIWILCRKTNATNNPNNRAAPMNQSDDQNDQRVTSVVSAKKCRGL
uniref:Ephrin RBD domain-containing protein n=1 Tax=Panagrellus redivivus TaxID=6233 RepID=A0A7E4ZUB4_PANRE